MPKKIRPPRPFAFALALASASAFAFAPEALSAPPDPQRKAACAAAFEKAQELQNESKLVEAREQFLACSAEDCPEVVRKECNAALPALESSLPSLVLGARDDKGNDIIDAKVEIDGTVVASRLEGKPLAVNPGPHTLRFSLPNAPAVEKTVVVRVGEKNRVVAVDVKPGAAAAKPAENEPDAPDAPSSGPSGKRIGAFVLGGLGVVSLGAFAILGVKGKGDLSDLQNGCGKTHSCAEADVDAAKTTLIAADVSLGVGIVSLGVATALFVTSRSAAKPANTGFVVPIVAPAPGGGAAMLVGHF